MSTPLVLLITYHFPPGNEIGGARLYRFYKYLKRLGYECQVITAEPQVPGAAPDIEYVADPVKSEPRKGIPWLLERIGRKFFWGNGTMPRWSALAFRAGRHFLKQQGNRDVVILSSAPPAATHLAGMAIAACSGRQWIADFRDPIHSASSKRPFLQGIFARGIEWLTLKSADLVLANTDAMQLHFHDRYRGLDNKTHVLWNGFDPEDTISSYVLPVRQRKVLSHVGELYGGRSIRKLLHAMARLIESSRATSNSILIRQIGPAEEAGLPNVEFLRAAISAGWLELTEPVPAKEARSMALDSDGLLLIQPQTAIQVPAKLFEYLRMGRPILAYVMRDSPSTWILQRAGVPFECIFPEDNPEQVEQRLLSFIAMLDSPPGSPNEWFSENFDGSRQVETLDALIRTLNTKAAGC